MRSALAGMDPSSAIDIGVVSDRDDALSLRLTHDNKPYSSWVASGANHKTLAEQEYGLQQLAAFFDSFRKNGIESARAEHGDMTEDRIAQLSWSNLAGCPSSTANRPS